ncbi:MAG: RidA family protein [Desulforhabdus sp.]|jgi:2-iminobutanoate/2-iminopropanoate deaminase|nr:RidA family protein [Desulforhabdus sp.]
MIDKKSINTDHAPAAIGPYSQGIVVGNLLFTSGQLPIDSKTGTLHRGPIEEQANLVLQNLAAIAVAAGTTLEKTVKTTVYLSDIKTFAQVNEVYKRHFSAPFPARSAFQVAALPLGADIEVEAVISL